MCVFTRAYSGNPDFEEFHSIRPSDFLRPHERLLGVILLDPSRRPDRDVNASTNILIFSAPILLERQKSTPKEPVEGRAGARSTPPGKEARIKSGTPTGLLLGIGKLRGLVLSRSSPCSSKAPLPNWHHLWQLR